jgi:chromosome segregation ATPase
VAKLKETETRLQLRVQEAQRRENVLNMRLATKQQETQEIMSQMHDLKQSQSSESSQLHSLMVDPAVNVMFSSMKRQLKEYKEKLEQAQNDLTAWKFTPDSVTGKKMMAKCRSLIQENAELGKQISQGRVAQLEAEIALHKKCNQEIKAAQDELNEFVIQLDEEVDAMQSAILSLQQQTKDSKATATASASVSAGNHGSSNHGNSGTSISGSVSKERTSSRYNGPLETVSMATTASSSSKSSARSSDS